MARPAIQGLLGIAGGYGDPLVGEAYARARDFCRGVPDPRQVVVVMFGQFTHHLTRGELHSALAIAEDFSQRAGRSGGEGIAHIGHGCRGIVLAHLGTLQEASENLQAAIALQGKVRGVPRRRRQGRARGQGALLWELRAAMGLAGLWLGHGRAANARHLLRPVCDRFSEGANSPDLRAAKAMLDTALA